MPTTLPASAVLTGTSVHQNLTDPALLMSPERLQSLAPSRLSAARAVLERMVEEGWTFERISFNINERSEGDALYRVHAGDRVFDFVAFGFEPDLSSRTGRITEKNWDMMGALIEGETTTEDRAVTRRELPKLYAGRAVPGTLTWSRSNRSFRAFEHVVDALVSGRQPEPRFLGEIGYLMRNTGLDGNGTFNTRSFLALEDDHPLRDPLHAQLFSAYLLREYAADLVDALARHRNPGAAQLAPQLRRMVGIGNGSALGLLFFVNTHPHLIDVWLSERQAAIVEASRIPVAAGSPEARRWVELLERASAFFAADPYLYHQFADPGVVADDLTRAAAALRAQLAEGSTTGEALLDSLVEQVSLEAWEVVAAGLLELLPADRLRQALDAGIVTESVASDPLMTVGELRDHVVSEYGWALGVDMEAPGARHYVWYKSADAEEPRRGPASEVREGRNWALDLPSDIQALDVTLRGYSPTALVGAVLADHPQQRGVIERIQSLAGRRLHSPHMNMLDESFVPVRVVRFMNAAVHGLDRTVDEGDDRNVLGLIFLGAPTAADLNAGAVGELFDWRYPAFPTSAELTVSAAR
jgi:hypothetical protein